MLKICGGSAFLYSSLNKFIKLLFYTLFDWWRFKFLKYFFPYFESFKDLLKLTQFFNCIHVAGGYPVEPIDIHSSIRHLKCIYEKLLLTDKVCHAYSLGSERVEDAIEMVRIASGLKEEEFQKKSKNIY